jgi:hypothetical protein
MKSTKAKTTARILIQSWSPASDGIMTCRKQQIFTIDWRTARKLVRELKLSETPAPKGAHK